MQNELMAVAIWQQQSILACFGHKSSNAMNR